MHGDLQASALIATLSMKVQIRAHISIQKWVSNCGFGDVEFVASADDKAAGRWVGEQGARLRSVVRGKGES
jgi:hypothetical protein